jgi:hypothetical protein
MKLSKLETLKLLRVSFFFLFLTLFMAIIYMLTNVNLFLYLFNILTLFTIIPLLLCYDNHNKGYRYSFNELKNGILNEENAKKEQ